MIGLFNGAPQGGAVRGSYRRHLVGFLLGVSVVRVASAEPLELVSLEKGSLHSNLEYSDTKIVEQLDDGIMVQTGGNEDWPAITFRANGKPWDLRGYYRLHVDLTNAGSTPLNIGVRLDNPYEKKEDAPQHAQGFEMLDPAETRTVSIRLSAEDWVFQKPLKLVGMRRQPGIELMDLSQIDRIQIFVGNTSECQTFIVRNIRVEGSVKKVDGNDFLPFVDQYGQYKHTDWEGKIHSDADFTAQVKAEKAELKQNPGIKSFNQYGGWKDGPKLKATGFFRVEKVDGKWWFVDPEGSLFWSTGPTCLNPDFGYTGVQDREHYFENLPKDDEPLGQFYSHSTWAPHGFYADKIPFKMQQTYKANLFRKYGATWEEQFVDQAHKRLKSWGMNTVANWAYPKLYLKQRTPYVAHFFIRDNRVLEASNGYWGQFHDVFDPSLRKMVRKNMAERKKEANDPWCLGFYVDNEMSWGGDGMSLSLETLACPAGQPAKVVFINDLKSKYGSIEKLNISWGTVHASWDALQQSTELPDAIRAGSDLKAFYKKSADTYFRTVRDELKKAAPNHLYLGCRFAWVNDTVAISSAEFCDVVSYNKYQHTVRGLRLPYYIDRPLIIGEYHFGATDRSHFHPGLREGDDQQQRADKFKEYMTSALDNPQMVGVHWFQYVDEHIAGRADEENYNVGLVDICDTPYPEMVEAIRETGETMYEYRRAKRQ